jgi:hypothetical protein
MVKHLSAIFRIFKEDIMYRNVIKESCRLIVHVIAAYASQFQEVFEHTFVGHVVIFGKSDKPDTYPLEEVVWVLSTLLFVNPLMRFFHCYRKISF